VEDIFETLFWPPGIILKKGYLIFREELLKKICPGYITYSNGLK